MVIYGLLLGDPTIYRGRSLEPWRFLGSVEVPLLRLLLEAEASDSRTLIDYRQMEDACDLDSLGLCEVKGLISCLKQEESEMHPPSLTLLIGLYWFIICLYMFILLLHVVKDIPRY